jgi:hypothetical protein
VANNRKVIGDWLTRLDVPKWKANALRGGTRTNVRHEKKKQLPRAFACSPRMMRLVLFIQDDGHKNRDEDHDKNKAPRLRTEAETQMRPATRQTLGRPSIRTLWTCTERQHHNSWSAEGVVRQSTIRIRYMTIVQNKGRRLFVTVLGTPSFSQDNLSVLCLTYRIWRVCLVCLVKD